ncbi:MAG: radical SAM family heme chaperone HemW [Ginsengibacter sp.]
MSGIYFHIPFCKQACHYCNFHFSTSLMYKNEMLTAMQKEISLVAFSALDNNKIDTIYFGGGTPSLLSAAEIKTFLQAAKEVYSVDKNAEITLEANPDDINEIKLNEWKAAGINRLSIGIQSFKQKDLEWMNRAHNTEQAMQCFAMIKSAGFTNYSVDLIYGTPGLDDDEWKKNIDTVTDMEAPHISCYALTVEPETALQKMILQKKKEDIDPEKQARHFLILMSRLYAAGYEHYEISNFALPTYRSRHNSSYWQGKPYIGIGPSAHSYFGNIRRWNISNNALYIKSLQNNLVPFEEEKLSLTQQLNEYVMTSLRTMEGLNLNFVKENFGVQKTILLKNQSAKFQENGKLVSINDNLVLTKEGKLFADGIAADLFFGTE